MGELPEIPAEVEKAIDNACGPRCLRPGCTDCNWRRDALETTLRTWARSIAEAERAHGEKLAEALRELVERRERACRDFGIPDRADGSDGRYARARAALAAWRNR